MAKGKDKFAWLNRNVPIGNHGTFQNFVLRLLRQKFSFWACMKEYRLVPLKQPCK